MMYQVVARYVMRERCVAGKQKISLDEYYIVELKSLYPEVNNE